SVEGAIRAVADQPGMPGAALTLAGIRGRMQLARDRMAYQLGQTSPKDQPPVSMKLEIERICAEFTHSRFGKMSVTFDSELPDDEDTHVVWSSWVIVEGALTELLWNAGKHGCDEEHPDVTARVTVAPEDRDSIRFEIVNEYIVDEVQDGPAKGW